MPEVADLAINTPPNGLVLGDVCQGPLVSLMVPTSHHPRRPLPSMAVTNRPPRFGVSKHSPSRTRQVLLPPPAGVPFPDPFAPKLYPFATPGRLGRYGSGHCRQ